MIENLTRYENVREYHEHFIGVFMLNEKFRSRQKQGGCDN